MRLAQRRAVITGGSSGLGLAIAHAFVSAGASVLLCGRRSDALEAAPRGSPPRSACTRSQPGPDLKDKELQQYFSQEAVEMTEIQKRSTETFAPLSGRPFQVHFYWNTVTERVEHNRGFKIKFNQQFEP
ncbi:MAG TPA: SDR family NAD(P)-dependent oxidoreductase [Gaiellaceae bacterium]